MEDIGYLEVNLPKFLQKDIDALKQGLIDKPLYLDCLYDEVYGSINSAFWGREISDAQAKYLRAKYLGIGEENYD
ncbi:MAG: hypothetical protein R3Y45_05510 [Bacillota bacterium]